jgi:hypothetical protein
MDLVHLFFLRTIILLEELIVFLVFWEELIVFLVVGRP